VEHNGGGLGGVGRRKCAIVGPIRLVWCEFFVRSEEENRKLVAGEKRSRRMSFLLGFMFASLNI
jgi:hypothetical protein